MKYKRVNSEQNNSNTKYNNNTKYKDVCVCDHSNDLCCVCIMYVLNVCSLLDISVIQWHDDDDD